ncbi:hypothetical protein JCM5353_000735 [Sporobolomyces roseus]
MVSSTHLVMVHPVRELMTTLRFGDSQGIFVEYSTAVHERNDSMGVDCQMNRFDKTTSVRTVKDGESMPEETGGESNDESRPPSPRRQLPFETIVTISSTTSYINSDFLAR